MSPLLIFRLTPEHEYTVVSPFHLESSAATKRFLYRIVLRSVESCMHIFCAFDDGRAVRAEPFVTTRMWFTRLRPARS